MRKSAFTLMEILIALTIVAVIATLTIPNVVSNISAKSNSAVLKSTYKQLEDAVQQALRDQDVRSVPYLDFDGDDNETKLSNFFIKYFDVTKNCGSSSGTCFGPSYTNKSGTTSNSPFTYDGYQFYRYVQLANGASIALRIDFSDDGCEKNYFMIDTNGPASPNKFGEDLFADIINMDGSFGVYGGIQPDSFETYKGDCVSATDAYGAESCLDLLKAKGWDLEHYLD